MKLNPVKLLRVSLELEEGAPVAVGRLAVKDREVLFEYDRGFLDTGLELSPFKLPLRPGVHAGDPTKFGGLHGVFDDSLPDGWGRLLIDRRAAKHGIPMGALTPLDRLSLIGSRSMGALVYAPEVELEPPTVVHLEELEADARAVLGDVSTADLDRLIALGGSPHGARPKVLVQIATDGSVIYGDRRARPGCEHWLVKFRSLDDSRQAGTLEHAYSLMAAAAGIDAPRSMMVGRKGREPGYFAVRRFDREGTRKLHLHTLAGLLQAPHQYAALSYRELLLATRQLTRDEAAVAQTFRRACFNVFAHNRDDHTRNFAFLMDARGAWRPTPAYDLTFSTGPGGEHTLLVDTEGANPTREHLVALARSVDLKGVTSVIEQVQDTVQRFPRFADEAGLPAAESAQIAKQLGLVINRGRSRSKRPRKRQP